MKKKHVKSLLATQTIAIQSLFRVQNPLKYVTNRVEAVSEAIRLHSFVSI